MDIPQEVIDAFDAVFPGHGEIKCMAPCANSRLPICFQVTFAGERLCLSRDDFAGNPLARWRAQGPVMADAYADSPIRALQSIVPMVTKTVQAEATTATKRANNAIEYANKVNANAELWANVAKMVQA